MTRHNRPGGVVDWVLIRSRITGQYPPKRSKQGLVESSPVDINAMLNIANESSKPVTVEHSVNDRRGSERRVRYFPVLKPVVPPSLPLLCFGHYQSRRYRYQHLLDLSCNRKARMVGADNTDLIGSYMTIGPCCSALKVLQ